MYSIGIDIGGTSIKAAAFDGEHIIGEVSRSSTLDDNGSNLVVPAVDQAIDELFAAYGESDCRAIGVGMPGLVDADGNLTGDSVNIPDWIPGGEDGNFQLKDYISTSRGVPVTVLNDGNAGAYGEWRLGAGKGSHTLVCISLGTGIGGGIIVNDRLVVGRNGMAGELGHIVVEPGGRDCNCGLSGCLERYSSATGLIQTAISLAGNYSSDFSHACLKFPPSAWDLYQALEAGDPLALAVHRSSSYYLARAVGILVQTLNPDTIVFSGGVADAGEIIISGIQEYLDDFVLPMCRSDISLGIAQLGSRAGVSGAAAYAWDQA